MMKTCSKCKVEKDVSLFNKQTASKDGLCRWCNQCRAAYRATYVRSEEGKEIDRINKLRYMQTERGKLVYKKSHDKYLENNYEKHLARIAVNNAIRDGKLIKASNCESCDGERSLHGHHHDYTKPLDVSWLCVPCHMSAHRPRA